MVDTWFRGTRDFDDTSNALVTLDLLGCEDRAAVSPLLAHLALFADAAVHIRIDQNTRRVLYLAKAVRAALRLAPDEAPRFRGFSLAVRTGLERLASRQIRP